MKLFKILCVFLKSNIYVYICRLKIPTKYNIKKYTGSDTSALVSYMKTYPFTDLVEKWKFSYLPMHVI